MDQNPNNENNNYQNQVSYHLTPKKSKKTSIIIIIIFLAIISVVVAAILLNKLNDKNNQKDLDIYGGWKTQSYDAETYWVFENDEFWWYQSYNNLNDNYWYGKMTIKTGREEIKKIGLNEGAIDTIIDNSQGKVTEDDIYTLTLTPKKIISNGVDKSSTNIPENSEWHYVWIIVDYGEDGLEGQVLNVDSSDITYYKRSN